MAQNREEPRLATPYRSHNFEKALIQIVAVPVDVSNLVAHYPQEEHD